jgi:hypothetical protein
MLGVFSGQTPSESTPPLSGAPDLSYLPTLASNGMLTFLEGTQACFKPREELFNPGWAMPALRLPMLPTRHRLFTLKILMFSHRSTANITRNYRTLLMLMYLNIRDGPYLGTSLNPFKFALIEGETTTRGLQQAETLTTRGLGVGLLVTVRLFPPILPLDILSILPSTKPLSSAVYRSIIVPRSPSSQLPGTMLSKTTRLDQHEIPGEPRSVVVHHYSLGALAELETDFRATIPSSPPCAVGVSIELAPVGPRIQTIALATPDNVFCLSLRQSPSPGQCKTLRGLFSNIPYLAGFEFPHIIVLLAHTLDSNVTGYDLSTLAFSKDRETTSPGGFLKSKNPSASARRINERWDGDILRSGEISSATPQPDYALRAWFTAMYVIFFYQYSIPIHLPHQRRQRGTDRFIERPRVEYGIH